MQGRYLWADGQLDILPGFSKTHHRDMLRQMIQEGRLSGVPQNIIAGDFMTDDFNGPQFDHITVVWDRGEHPTPDEIRYMIGDQLGRYGREAEIQKRIAKLAATSEDTEPSGASVGFLSEPKKVLYPPLFPDGETIPKEVSDKIKDHVLDALANTFDNPDAFIYFTIYGSGISYNWDEGGDLDLQMWVDFSKFVDQNNANWTADDLLAEVRRTIGPLNFPTFADLGIPVPPDPKEPCEGTMMIQYYAKLGTGAKDENLASQPYSCYDMETNKWLVKPKPMPPTFYGNAFITLMPKATDMAVQAEALLSEYNRNVLNWQFWFGLYSRHKKPAYHKAYLEAQRNAILEKQSIKTMFNAVFGGRAEAYAPGGKGIHDERDIMQKLLEVWGIFQELKHYAREPLPWDEQELPESPSEDSTKSDSDQKNGNAAHDTKNLIISHGWTIAEKSAGWGDEDEISGTDIDTMFPNDPGEINPDRPHARFMYHVTKANPDEILSYGLNWDRRNFTPNEDFNPEGVYVYDTIDLTRRLFSRSNVNLFKVDTYGLPMEQDRLGGTGAWRILSPVSPDRLQLIHSYIPFERPLQPTYPDDPKKDRYRQARWTISSPNDSPEHINPGGWPGIMEKAQRLRQEGGVQVQRNGVQNIVGTVQGDHGTYNTEIWRSDPQKNTISLWNCTCPWGEVSWGRTRQFKKFEGRPCAHTLALYWEALTHPLDEDYGPNQQLQIPGLDPNSNDGVDLNQALQQTVRPTQPSQLTSPPTGGDAMQQEQLTFPGTFSKWHKAGAALMNGDFARTNKQMIGYDDRGTQYTVPRNSIVEIIWSDPNETIAIYSLDSPALGPHNARITDETSNFSWVPRTRGTAPRRRR